jgi:hypothetical protein
MNIYTTQRRCVLGSKHLKQLSEKKKKKNWKSNGGINKLLPAGDNWQAHLQSSTSLRMAEKIFVRKLMAIKNDARRREENRLI